MAKPPARAINIPKWRYSCVDCGRCCTVWHVELSKDEQKRLALMDWDKSEGIPEKRTVSIQGGDYIAHHENGDCIYLNREKNCCRIHAKFGYDAKPLGCRVYPFSIAPTFPERFSCICRFDCPAVRTGEGRPIRESIDAIRSFVGEMELKDSGYDEDILMETDPARVEKLVSMLIKNIVANEKLGDVDRAVCAVMSVTRIQNLGHIFVNDIDLDEIMPSFFDRVIQDRREGKVRRLGAMEQMRFLSVLTAFLRRDEEAVGTGLLGRLRRTVTMTRMYFGKTNLHDLGAEHPDAMLDRKMLFDTPVVESAKSPYKLLWDLIRVRLESYQFMGPSLYGLTFFIGMKFLFMLVPLTMALAKWKALVRDPKRCEITEEDVDYAVGAIDHSFGRSALLGFGMVTSMVRHMTDPDCYAALIARIMKSAD